MDAAGKLKRIEDLPDRIDRALEALATCEGIREIEFERQSRHSKTVPHFEIKRVFGSLGKGVVRVGIYAGNGLYATTKVVLKRTGYAFNQLERTIDSLNRREPYNCFA